MSEKTPTSVRLLKNLPDPFDTLRKNLTLFEYLQQPRDSLPHIFDNWTLEDLRVLSRSVLPEMSQLVRISRRKKEGMLVLLRYMLDAPAQLAECLRGRQYYPWFSTLSATQRVDRSRAFQQFLTKLQVLNFQDLREHDFPLPTKRMHAMQEREKAFRFNAFQHRILFSESKRSLLLGYNGAPAFELQMYDLEYEEALKVGRKFAEMTPPVLPSNLIFSFVTIRVYVPGASQALSSEALLAYQRRMYYFSPYNQYPEDYDDVLRAELNAILGSIIGPEMFSTNGTNGRLCLIDILAVLLDITQLFLCEPEQASLLNIKMRSVNGLQPLGRPRPVGSPTPSSSRVRFAEPEESPPSSLPSSPIKKSGSPASSPTKTPSPLRRPLTSEQRPHTIDPRRTALPTFIGHNTLTYVNNRQYNFATSAEMSATTASVPTSPQ